MSMILWSFVALLALFGLVWLFARDAKRAKAEAPSLRRMIVDQVAADLAAHGRAEVNATACKPARKPEYRLARIETKLEAIRAVQGTQP